MSLEKNSKVSYGDMRVFGSSSSGGALASLLTPFNHASGAAPAQDQAPQQSLMGKLQPGVNYEAPAIDTSSMKRTAELSAPDLSIQKDRAVQARGAVNDVKADLTQSWDRAKTLASDAISSAAVKQGHNAQDALRTIMPGKGSSEILAVAGFAGDALMGGGTIATMGTGLMEARSEGRKLKPDEARAVAEEALRSLQQHGQRLKMTFTGAAQPDAPKADMKFQWQNLSVEDFKEFAAADLKDQPEMEALDQKLASLDEVDANHEHVEDHQFDEITPDKLADLQERGALKKEISQPQVETLTAAAATDFSNSLREISGLKPDLKSAAELTRDIKEMTLAFKLEEERPDVMPKPGGSTPGMAA